MIAVGLSSSILGCLLTLLVYTYCQRYQQQSHDATVIHPVAPAPLNTSITNHINKLDKYDSVEAIKVRDRQTDGQGTAPGSCWQSSGVVASVKEWRARYQVPLMMSCHLSFALPARKMAPSIGK